MNPPKRWQVNLGDKLLDWSLLRLSGGGEPHNKDVLDLGPGSAVDALIMGASAKSWTAVDIDPEVIAWAQTVCPSVNGVIVDLNEAVLPFADESFDLIIDFSTLDDTQAPWAIYSEISRVLRSGATFISTFANKDCGLDISQYPEVSFKSYQELDVAFSMFGMKSFFKPQDRTKVRGAIAAIKL